MGKNLMLKASQSNDEVAQVLVQAKFIKYYTARNRKHTVSRADFIDRGQYDGKYTQAMLELPKYLGGHESFQH